MSALGPSGGTICLTGPSYTESFSASTSLTIQGISAASTVVNGELIFNSPVHLQGFQVSGDAQLNGAPSVVENMGFVGLLEVNADATITASKIVNPGGNAVYNQNGSNPTVLFDGVDISAPANYGLYFGGDTAKLTVQNSYFHDSSRGAVLATSSSIAFVNNTFVNAGLALNIGCTDTSAVLAFTYENNLFVDNQVAVTVSTPCGGQMPLFASNGYYGNTNNFAGTAVDGAGDVKTDPLLQTTVTPPTLGAGSPAIGAGLTSVAPATDYWGNPRGASVDLGCVQSP